jgi:hypothetical protein
MFTQVISSLIVTIPLPSQSPAHAPCALADAAVHKTAPNAKLANQADLFMHAPFLLVPRLKLP